MRKLLLGFALLACAGFAFAADTPAPPPVATLSGKVLEVKDVETYTYMRLQTKDGELWAAVNKAPVKVGAEVTIYDPAVMINFQSKTLNRTFDRIVFGSIGVPPAGAAPVPTDMAAVHAGMAGAAGADIGNVKVAKAKGPDARTVAEVTTQYAALKGKTVAIHGTVVKFTPEVMGKNWVHLRDGSGSAADGTNDILVTTKDETKIGDVVLAKGVVATDRDLGSGYSYKVLVEDAKLSK